MKSLVFERTYKARREKVWQALTDGVQMKEWFFEVSDFKPEVGFRFVFTGENDGITFRHSCVVVEVLKPEKLSFSWRYEGYPGQSLVTFELFEAGQDSTRLRLTHSGTETFTHADFAKADFSEGWNGILGDQLRNFVETDEFKRSIRINAPADIIWDIVLHPNGQWGLAFGGGATAETDWSAGSPVIWKDSDGNIGARGIVETHQPGSQLHLHYYDELESPPGTPPGDYSERISLIPENDGGYTLQADVGLITKKDIPFHAGMWDKAFALIKELAEKKA